MGEQVSATRQKSAFTGASLGNISHTLDFRCIYACQLCEDYPETKRRAEFVAHLKDTHDAEEEAYVHDYGVLETEHTLFNCAICNDTYNVYQHVDAIRQHLESKHDGMKVGHILILKLEFLHKQGSFAKKKLKAIAKFSL